VCRLLSFFFRWRWWQLPVEGTDFQRLDPVLGYPARVGRFWGRYLWAICYLCIIESISSAIFVNFCYKTLMYQTSNLIYNNLTFRAFYLIYMYVLMYFYFDKNPSIWSWRQTCLILRWGCHSRYQSNVEVKYTLISFKMTNSWGTFCPGL
jgi:hypothetical protein